MSLDEKKSAISFGFSRTNEARKLQASSLAKHETIEKNEEKDYIVSVEDNTICGTVEEPKAKELVIPLITTNRWRSARKPEELEQEQKQEETDVNKQAQIKTGDTTVDLAVTEILQDVERSGGAASGDDSMLSIPLLMKNKIPDGYETDDKLDVALRPDEATPADYDAIPIEQFGLAMLRGMGWKQGEGVGKNKQNIKPIEAQLRPKGLGLGADRSGMAQRSGVAEDVKEYSKEKLVMKCGTHCVVLSGKRDGQYGTVVSLDEDNSRVMVSMALGDETLNLSQLNIKLVSKKEYDKCHKYLNKLKADKYQDEHGFANGDCSGSKREYSRETESEQSPRHKSRRTEGDRASEKHRRSRSKDRTAHSNREKDSKYRESDKRSDTDKRNETSRSESRHRYEDGDVWGSSKHDEHTASKDKKHRSQRFPDSEINLYSNTTSGSKTNCWLQPNLRVRVIDEKYKNGKYFKEKVIIEDVIAPEKCICRTPEGKVLEGMHQSQLETVIPRDGRSFVMLVTGKHKSQLGELLSRDKTNSTAVVQLLRDRDTLLTAAYEELCEYTGDIDTQFDY